MQCPVLKYRLGLKTAPVQCTLKSRTDNRYRHILDRVARGRKMTANGEVCVSQPGRAQMFTKSVTQASSSFADVYLSASTTSDQINHVATGTGILVVESNTTPGGINTR